MRARLHLWDGAYRSGHGCATGEVPNAGPEASVDPDCLAPCVPA